MISLEAAGVKLIWSGLKAYERLMLRIICSHLNSPFPPLKCPSCSSSTPNILIWTMTHTKEMLDTDYRFEPLKHNTFRENLHCQKCTSENLPEKLREIKGNSAFVDLKKSEFLRSIPSLLYRMRTSAEAKILNISCSELTNSDLTWSGKWSFKHDWRKDKCIFYIAARDKGYTCHTCCVVYSLMETTVLLPWHIPRGWICH